ncbi:putative 1-phosphatidylinositol phosphodiesterase precursor [Cladorrhinum sp. PSN259]|nr:putative 1-phosphatidylinositol phosphodiesterase precursor [Cladorrhinum sp. PSN259]
MGLMSSRPKGRVAAASSTMPETITIRNLTITPLELVRVERIEGSSSHGNSKVNSAKVAGRIAGRKLVKDSDTEQPSSGPPSDDDRNQDASSSQDISGHLIEPFTERVTIVYPPYHDHPGEQLRLTFEEPGGTGHRYTATIPTQSPKSIVLKSIGSSSGGKEFTAIYIPHHAYLSLFSSANLSSWMSQLDPSIPLSSLSIPGTHNSPTCYVALPSVRCQAVSVTDQLLNGVRFLDVRVNCPNGNSSPSLSSKRPDLALVHSAFPISLSGPKYLASLLQEIYNFLDTHPSETILISIKREGTGRGTDQLLSKILATHYLDAWRWHTAPSIPTLGQVRGKIVLVRRFHVDPSLPSDHGLGIDGSVWPDNVADGTCGSGRIRIQDYYEVKETDQLPTKIQYAQDQLERCAESVLPLPFLPPSSSSTTTTTSNSETTPQHQQKETPFPLYINFLSASNFFNAQLWPEKIAVKINPKMIEYLCMGHACPGKGQFSQKPVGDAATGVVVTDWVGHDGDWDLIRCIVGWNARLQLKV